MGISSRKFLLEAAVHTNILKELSQEEKIQLQKLLLGMLNDIICICNKYGFCYMLVYGSALGAVRHGGFIPWDDDLDIGILRKDYVPFLETLKREFAEKYEVEYPEGTAYSSSIFAKIYLKGTKYMEIFNLYTPFSKGIFMDIFPIENMPNNLLKHGVYGLFFDTVLYITNSVRFYKYSNTEFKEYMSHSRHSKCFYRIRMLIGYIFSFMSYTRWCRFYNRWISSLPEGNFLGIPTARKHFLRGRLRRNVFLPTAVGSFENKVVPLPGNVHKYLDHEYGNYMDIPDINKRERHFVVEFDTGNAR